MIVVKDFGRIIGEEVLGDTIFSAIYSEYLKNGSATVNMEEVMTIATFCSKQIFGQLCVKLGEKEFFDKIIIINSSEQVKTSIRTGVLYALQDNKQG